MNTRNARIALALAAAGFAAIVAAWLTSRTGAGIPGWEPVDTELHATIASLHANETEQASRSPSPQLSNASAAPPSGETAPASSPALNASPTPPTPTAPISPPSNAQSQSPSGSTALTPDPNDARLDLNAATQAQLEDLPGIGPSKAKAIVAYREQHGGFRSIDELLQVKGIGPKMFEKLRPEVAVR